MERNPGRPTPQGSTTTIGNMKGRVREPAIFEGSPHRILIFARAITRLARRYDGEFVYSDEFPWNPQTSLILLSL